MYLSGISLAILTAGGRYDYVRNDLDSHTSAHTMQKDNAFTGRVGLTYLTERFKDFPHGVHITLQGVPRSLLAEYAEANM